MALTEIQKVRLEIQDNTPGLYILSDDEITYFLEKNSNSIAFASMDSARAILFNLAQRTDETVDIFSIRGGKAAEQYRLALELFLRDPNLNPVLKNVQAYFGGISLADMRANDANLDNNTVNTPYDCPPVKAGDFFSY